jgi:hypothetical protein
MKTRKHNLNAIALGIALAMGSASALASVIGQPPVANPAESGALGIVRAELANDKPTFNSNELVGLCLIESTVSMLAARTNDFGCDNAYYDLQVATTSPTEATAELDGGVGLGGTTLEGRVFPTRDIGTKCLVNDARGLNLIGKLELVNYNGAHGWSKTNEIFNSDALIKIRDRQTGSINKYREVDIKDFFKDVIDGRSWEFDWGLEDIKKFRAATTNGPEFYYPVQKWHELSWYRHENGGEGGLWVKKFQVIPRSAAGCTIRVEAYDVNNGTGEFYIGAKVKVGRETLSNGG